MNSKSLTLHDLIKPKPALVAKRDYIAEVQRALNLDDDTAQRVADFVLAEVERIGGETAQVVFSADGAFNDNPFCSWCGFLAGLCPHIAGKPEQEMGDAA